MAYAISLIGMLQHCIRTSAEVENLVRNFKGVVYLYFYFMEHARTFDFIFISSYMHAGLFLLLRWYQLRE